MHKGREEREENNYFAKFYRKKNDLKDAKYR
jgi:hypothetical protein